MLERGKLAVLAMFAIGVLAASFAWWWNYQGRRKCLDFYGPAAALAIRTGDEVELLELEPDRPDYSPATVDALQVGPQTFRLYRARSISKSNGLIHARTSLVDDSSYVWDADVGASLPDVQFAVRFIGDSQATLAFDLRSQRLWHVESGKSVALIPKVAEGWKSFLNRQASNLRQLEPARTAPSE